MSSQFYDRVVGPAQAADVYIAELGGLPVITAAAENLRRVLDQTREEIETATFADRFLDFPNDMLRQEIERGRYTPDTKAAVEAEGEKGLKRAQLRAGYRTVEGELNLGLSHLVALRADLVISQTDFDEPAPTQITAEARETLRPQWQPEVLAAPSDGDFDRLAEILPQAFSSIQP